jgi:hypothetical protein
MLIRTSTQLFCDIPYKYLINYVITYITIRKIMKVFEILDRYKANSLINPENSANEIATAQQAADYIKIHCRKFVEAYQEGVGFIFRGVKDAKDFQHSDGMLIQADIRPNREPLFLNRDYQVIVDKAMESLGLKARRGNSIFSTTSAHTAGVWGSTYIIFVRDGWDATVFKKAKKQYVYDYLHFEEYHVDSTPDEQDKIDIVKAVLINLKPKRFNDVDSLIEIINDGYEDILITGSGYIGLKLSDRGLDRKFFVDVLDLLGIPN